MSAVSFSQIRAFRCLVADDQPLLRDALARHISGQPGMEVVAVADSGDSAAELLAQLQPDVAVLEPAIDGVELSRRFAAETAVVLFSGARRPALLEDALAAGARGFVLKTSPVGEIVSAVRTVLEGGTYVDPRMAAALVAGGGPGPAAPPRLTGRERQVLELLAGGATNQRIADVLFLSPSTIRSYIELAIRKLDASNRTHAVALALRAGLIE
jgi:two-component system response regulator DesR